MLGVGLNGILSGTHASGTAGSYALTLTASNGVGSPATQSFTLIVGQAPTITSANNTAFTAGSPGSFTVTANVFLSTSFTEVGSLPSGVTLSTAGILSGTTTVSGSYIITITANNGIASNAAPTFTLTVNPRAADRLSISPDGQLPVLTGLVSHYAANRAGGPPLRWQPAQVASNKEVKDGSRRGPCQTGSTPGSARCR
jgi:putative Ig domain-containing protein